MQREAEEVLEKYGYREAEDGLMCRRIPRGEKSILLGRLKVQSLSVAKRYWILRAVEFGLAFSGVGSSDESRLD